MQRIFTLEVTMDDEGGAAILTRLEEGHFSITPDQLRMAALSGVAEVMKFYYDYVKETRSSMT